jgi:hypothetical protein
MYSSIKVEINNQSINHKRVPAFSEVNCSTVWVSRHSHNNNLEWKIYWSDTRVDDVDEVVSFMGEFTTKYPAFYQTPVLNNNSNLKHVTSHAFQEIFEFL